MGQRKKKITKFEKILLFVVMMLSIILLTYFSIKIYSLNIFPTKYFILGYVFLIILLGILTIPITSSKNRIVRYLSTIMIIGIDILSIYLAGYVDDTQGMIQGLTAKKDYLSYSIVARKDTCKFEELSDKIVGYLQDDNSDLIKANVSKDFEVQFKEYTDLFKMYDELTDETIDSFVIDSELLTILEEEEENLFDEVEVIHSFDLELDLEIKKEESDITKEPFVLYISGIDQYGDLRTTRGRSDVNILAIVNPKTHKILLVNTPRDYYVQLHGTTGLRDKLTHAGIYGINKSIDTIQDIYDIKIDHYIRINFNTLITLIDEIGGVDIEADKTFTAHTNRDVHIEKGWNHLNGVQALAYSRERYAYIDGDHHRGRNQEQVITAIINKVTTTTTLITKYSKIMSTLSNSFQTDMDTDTITSFMKYQIEYMPKWNVESTAVIGSNSKNYTYSMGTNYLLYVMEPDYDSIRTAKKKMVEVFYEE